MALKTRISPIPEAAKDSEIEKFFGAKISYSKMERMKAFKAVIFSFANDDEAEKAIGKLNDCHWGKTKLEVSMIGKKDAAVAEAAPAKEDLSKLPQFDGPTQDLKKILKFADKKAFQKNKLGQNLLHLITLNSQFSEEQIQILIDHGFAIDELDLEMATPLHRSRFANATEKLLKAGADHKAVDKDGWTALHYAAANGYLDICKTLTKHGADINSISKKGETPWDVKFSGLDIEELLYSLGARSGTGKTERTKVEPPRFDWFWEHFTADENANSKVRLKAILDELGKRSPEEIGIFTDHFFHLIGEAYRPVVCGFNLVLGASSNDDGFEDFIAWVISKGQKFYETALKNPEKLVDSEMDWEDFDIFKFREPIVELYSKKSGKKVLDLEDVSSQIVFDFKNTAEGEDFDWDEARLKKKFPKLMKKFYKE